LRVNIVTSSISRNSGGVGPVVKHLAEALQKLSCDTTLCCRLEEDTFKGLPANREFKVIAGPSSKYCLPSGSRQLNKRLVNTISDIDIVHCHALWESCLWSAAAIARENRKPYVVTPHGMLDPWAINNSRWKKKIIGLLFTNKYLRSAACIHALCESEYQSIRAYGLNNPVAIIPNGIDLPEVNNDLPALWEGQIPKDKKVMLFLGRIHPKKGLPNLIKAWALLQQSVVSNQQSEWVQVIAGWSQIGHEDELKDMIKEFSLEKDIIFLGPVFDEKKQACLQNVDAFILPSLSEGLPMSVLEAWAYELPVIMTLQCNIPEGFAANAAIEIRPDVDSIAEGLKSFISLPEEQQKQMGQNGLHLVKQKFTWPKIAADMIDVYKWLLGQGDRPDCVRMD